MRCNKQLAYVKVNVNDRCYDFEELYTFTKPTILYLPHNFILTVCDISDCTITINIKNLCDNCINVTKKISLCCCDSVHFDFKVNCKCFNICIKLCDIKILRPCC